MVTHTSILAYRIPWTEEPGGLQLWGHKKVRPDLATNTHTHTHTYTHERSDLNDLYHVVDPTDQIWKWCGGNMWGLLG